MEVRSGVCSGRLGGFGAVGKLMGPVGRGGGGSQGARCEARPFGRGVAGTSSAPVRGAGTTGSAPKGRAAGGSGEPVRPSAPSPTAPDADANRSSSESRAGVGPVSSVESSYNSLHQSSS
ncbi:hypothetical protein [Streptomyces luteogriseus]|uniref:hypothetical protein n=1 Tax=Streptomyces luteogriseus TaxID=68233 RepID=UPI0027D82020|nr:hypothetical protein [Streptomyces luteogriseus]